MKKHFLLLFTVLSIQGCADETKSSKEETGSPVIYKKKKEFSFLVSHISDNEEVYRQDTLVLTTSDEILSKEYGQTKSSWALIGKNGWKSYSGIEEGDTAVWIHPPRNGLYRKLELNPFPMIKNPLEVGNKWSWSLLIGNHYSVEGYAEWADDKNEKFVSRYEITRIVPLTTDLGVLYCYEILSFTESNFEPTQLKAYYNKDYGFVKLDYLNIDKSRLFMELIKVKSVQAKPVFTVPVNT